MRVDNLVLEKQNFIDAISNFPNEEKEIILNCMKYSEAKHSQQKRKNGTSYIIHPLRVAIILLKEVKIFDVELICAALLHDIVEDTQTSLEEIKQKFGTGVSAFVEVLSKVSGEEQEKYLTRVMESSYKSILLKLSDRLDNCRDMLSIAKVNPNFVNKQVQEVEKYFLPFTKKFDPYFNKQLEYNVSLARNLMI